MKIIIQLVYILLSLVSALLGFAIVYWISGWIGYPWTLWGCAVIVFFVFVIGIGETIIDGLVPAAVITILSLVSVDDDGHYTEPPFDHVLIFDTGNPERVPRRRYIPFDQARFELRPVSWITKP